MNYTKWLKWAVLGGLSLVPFIMFIIADGGVSHNIYIPFPNLFFPYITGKNFAFRILIEIICALYVILAVREPKYRPRASVVLWALAALVGWMAVATIFSVDPSKSFWSNFERMDGYITQLHLLALFIVAGAMLAAEQWWVIFFRTAVAASAVQGLTAIFQAYKLFGFEPSSQSGARADTTFGNATYLAVFMLFMFFITLYLFIRDRKSLNARWLYGAALVLQFLGLYFTQTRGAILGLLGGLLIAAVYVAVFGRGTQWQGLRRWCLGGLGALVLLVVLFLGLKNSSFVQHNETLQRLASISLSDPTTQSRFIIWGEALKGIEQKPVTGWGQENFNFVFNKYYNPEMYNQEQWFDRAHDMFIDYAVAGGVPAFLLYVALFCAAAWAVYRSQLEVPEQAVFFGLLAGYAFNNLFVFDNLVSYIYFIMVLAFVHGLSRRERPGALWMQKPLGDHAVAVVFPIVLVLCAWGGWELNAPGIARAQTIIDALTPVNLQTGAQRDPKENLAAFQTAVSYGGLGYQEAVEQLYQFATNEIAPSTSASPDLKQQTFDATLQAGQALMKGRPHDARLELFNGVFLAQFGQYQQALAALQQALSDSPGKQQVLLELGSVYLSTGDAKDGLATFAQAFNEEQQNDNARTFYAAGLYEAGQGAQADALLLERFGTTTVDNQELMQAFFATKQYGRLANIYALRLSQNPNDVQSQAGYAIAEYFATGDKTAAVATLNKIMAQNPQYAGQVQSLINQIQNGTLKP
jgi:O-antigen ligase/cytochrome c-type biogenesis protein CcmH/NrfG